MIIKEGGCYRYFDKNGAEIFQGSKILCESGDVNLVCLTDNGELGIDATNPLWVASGRAVPCEYGVYPLSASDTESVEVIP